jgi:hypothetical protein
MPTQDLQPSFQDSNSQPATNIQSLTHTVSSGHTVRLKITRSKKGEPPLKNIGLSTARDFTALQARIYIPRSGTAGPDRTS